MFHVYAVRIINEEKHRYLIGTPATLNEAKHLVNRAVCGNADYAYVTDKDSTVFFLKRDQP